MKGKAKKKLTRLEGERTCCAGRRPGFGGKLLFPFLRWCVVLDVVLLLMFSLLILSLGQEFKDFMLFIVQMVSTSRLLSLCAEETGVSGITILLKIMVSCFRVSTNQEPPNAPSKPQKLTPKPNPNTPDSKQRKQKPKYKQTRPTSRRQLLRSTGRRNRTGRRRSRRDDHATRSNSNLITTNFHRRPARTHGRRVNAPDAR